MGSFRKGSLQKILRKFPRKLSAEFPHPFLGVATPEEPRCEKKTFFLRKRWAVENFSKSAAEKFLSGLRGAKHFSDTFRIVLRVFLRVFQTLFRMDYIFFRGQFRSGDMPS